MTVQILIGDCREKLRSLPAGSVHCVVTSPPYFGLRDYGIGASLWGGEAGCDHIFEDSSRVGGGRQPTGKTRWQHSTSERPHGHGVAASETCSKCGAWSGGLGLEPSPHLFVQHLVEVFREVWRVLRDDGVCWVNLGDSYANDGKWGGSTGGRHHKHFHGQTGVGRGKRSTGLKPKDLIGIPWRVAFALQDDGWYLRQDIVWHKPNPMPESVTDRCTKAHEYIFMLTKSERYYFDSAAIAEPAVYSGLANQDESGFKDPRSFNGKHKAGYRSGGRGRGVPQRHAEQVTNRLSLDGERGGTRNKRSVWTVPTKPFGEAHFATFPPALIEPCILAGCPEGGTVLDPFGGAGTTGLVADRLRRNAVLIELNPEYAEMARRRIFNDAPLFMEAAQ